MLQPAPLAPTDQVPHGSTSRRSRAAAAESISGARSVTVPPVWRELLLVAVFYSVYFALRLVLVQDGTADAFRNADQIIRFEQAIGLDVELGLNEALLSVPWLARLANTFYATAHFAVTISVVVWLYRRRPAQYRWLRTALVSATAVALLGFWLYPLAPPRFLTDAGFVDPVVALGSTGLYSSGASGSLTNQYAAMPSMHAGWALWCGLALILYGGRRWTAVAGLAYATVTVWVILATANHYIVDAVVGNAIVLGALAASWTLIRRRSRRTPAPSRPEPAARACDSRPAARPSPRTPEPASPPNVPCDDRSAADRTAVPEPA